MDEIVVQLDDTPELIIELTELSLDITISDIQPEATIVLTETNEPDIIEVIPDLPFYVQVFEWPNCPDEPYVPSITLPITSENVMHNGELLSSVLGKVKGINGGVFITDISPTTSGNVGNKITSSAGFVLDSCLVDTNLITVSIVALTGHTNYIPIITVNDVSVTLLASSDKPIFTGTVQLDITATNVVVAKHEDGAQHSCVVDKETAPNILSVTFIGAYPGIQTELKAGDSFSLHIICDSEVKTIEIDNFSACTHSILNVGSGTEHTVNVVIANRGNSTIGCNASVRVQKITGSWSEWALSNNTVNLNNSYPIAMFGTITYPIGQKALKNSETASVVCTATDYDEVSFTSQTNELAIVNSSENTGIKTVSRLSGGYNISSPNLSGRFTRIANGASTDISCIVNIANVAATVSVSLPAARLRSPANHVIGLVSNQQLYQIPTIVAPEGTWLGTGFTTSNFTTFSRTLSVQDNNLKGSFSFNTLVAINLAGIVTTNIINSSYVIGGFLLRVLTIPAFPTRQANIGTSVSNSSKLRCTNLSKGATGSLNYNFVSSTTEALNSYTIVNNDTWYNCDGANASSNTTGTMQIELEEVV